MITFPNAKINLGLNITSRRPDGYHDLSSCFIPVGWRDALEAIPASKFEFNSTGLCIPGHSSQNLCVKAFELLKADYKIDPVKMHLHKVIPMEAGLGGGSADGAFCLKLLNDLFELRISIEALEMYAKQLGADCPFFIQNKPKLVTGIGDQFEDIDLDLGGYQLVIIYPNIHVETSKAFSRIVPAKPEVDIRSMVSNDLSKWQNRLINDFEKPVFDRHPEIRKIKMDLLDQGAIYASMSGSGSSVYGIFESIPEDLFKGFSGDQIWSGLLGLQG